MMPGSIPSIDPGDAAAAAETGALIVDVREADEFAAERAEGVVLMPISEFVARHRELPKDRPLLMLCAAGSRSASATAYLLQHDPESCPERCGGGWTDVRNVTGGMMGWRRAGLPIRSGTPETGEGDLPG
jgi:rhodanese-related sulfurtransferase